MPPNEVKIETVIASEAKQSSTVIPGRCEASSPESRDSGSGAAHHPGMTILDCSVAEFIIGPAKAGPVGSSQ
jgi:hypothetical protein